MIKAKREARLKCIQRNTRANQEQYNRKRIAAARVCCRKKREALKGKVDAIVEHHTKNESKEFYKRTQEVTQEFKPSINVCRSEDGKILTENEDVQRRWKEYFESILTGNLDETDSMTVYKAENKDIQPSYKEVTHVIQCLKEHKVAGTNQIVAEFLKKGGETLWRRIHHLVKLIWTQHKIPEDWSIAIIHPIHKKGDKLECSNYRAITLLNVTYKVLSGILYNRLAEYAEEILGDYQCGFRTNHSTIDHFFTIKKRRMNTIYTCIICI